MNRNFLTILFLICGTLLISCSKGPDSEAGGKNPVESPAVPVGPHPQGTDFGSGGNAYAAEFKDIGRTVVRKLKAKNIQEIKGVSVRLLEETLEKLTVKPTDAVLKKGEDPVDALNFPNDQRVELSLVHWASSLDFYAKRRLVIHEVLGLMRKDDSGYDLTTGILTTMGSNKIDFGSFHIIGQVAKTLIEKIPWQSDEVSKDGNATWYKIPSDAAWNKEEIKCLKVDPPTPEEYDFRCWIKKSAYLGEDGVIYVTLVEEDGNHALWRLFDSIKERRFDYGTIKGDLDKMLHKLEFYL